jgi:hypothetical protein
MRLNKMAEMPSAQENTLERLEISVLSHREKETDTFTKAPYKILWYVPLH